MDARHVLFAHVTSRPDEEIDLAAAALLIAEVEYPGLDIAHYLSVLDGMAEGARRVAQRRGVGLVEAMNGHLFDELGFVGNDADYYDPRNSFLNEVIDRRVGIPITLSVIYLEVARRLGLELVGISFPGHFLVGEPVGGGMRYLDPYHGGIALQRHDLEERLARALGGTTQLSPEHLAPAPKRQILTRMLNNLRGIYHRMGDIDRQLGVLERLAILNPHDTRIAEAMETLRKEAGSSESN